MAQKIYYYNPKTKTYHSQNTKFSLLIGVFGEIYCAIKDDYTTAVYLSIVELIMIIFSLGLNGFPMVLAYMLSMYIKNKIYDIQLTKEILQAGYIEIKRVKI